jgi:two-component system, chemotaxis family, sensor kinase CheA
VSIDMTRLRALFTEEANEHAAALESGVLALEARPDDRELIDDLFRAAHSLKGASGSVGFLSLSQLMHSLETLLDAYRSGDVSPNRAHVDLLLRGCDGVRRLLGQGAQHAEDAALPPDLLALCSSLDALAELDGAATGDDAAAASAQPVPRRGFRIRFKPKTEAFQWGSDPLLVIRELQGLSSQLRIRLDSSELPSLELLDCELSYLAWQLELELEDEVDQAALGEAFAFVEGLCDFSIEPLASIAAPVEIVNSQAIDAPEARAARGNNDASTIRVATEKIDRLVDLVGELVIAHSAVRELSRDRSPEGASRLQEAVLQSERHLRELQERVMSVRMVPVANVLSRLPRVVRETSAQLGKEIQLQLDGGETELDKSLAERLGDPLLHLVRNALDHGIETPDVRLAAGKPAAGTLRVTARPRGGSVVIEVSDDGRGLDRNKILKKAIQQGLAAEGAALSDEEVFALITQPGFSTAEQVTSVSGRGVGLDVVRRNIEEIGGELAILSEPGRGATFVIRLPLTLTIMEGLLLRAGATVCVVPLTDVAFSVRLKPEQQRRLAGLSPVVDLPSETLPAIDLAELLGQGPANEFATLAVVVQTGTHRFALKVDALLGQAQVVVKSLETHFRRVPGMLGATILGDGKVALILDGVGLAQCAGLDRVDRHIGQRARVETTPWN